jgi:hypothetical protein
MNNQKFSKQNDKNSSTSFLKVCFSHFQKTKVLRISYFSLSYASSMFLYFLLASFLTQQTNLGYLFLGLFLLAFYGLFWSVYGLGTFSGKWKIANFKMSYFLFAGCGPLLSFGLLLFVFSFCPPLPICSFNFLYFLPCLLVAAITGLLYGFSSNDPSCEKSEISFSPIPKNHHRGIKIFLCALVTFLIGNLSCGCISEVTSLSSPVEQIDSSLMYVSNKAGGNSYKNVHFDYTRSGENGFSASDFLSFFASSESFEFGQGRISRTNIQSYAMAHSSLGSDVFSVSLSNKTISSSMLSVRTCNYMNPDVDSSSKYYGRFSYIDLFRYSYVAGDWSIYPSKGTEGFCFLSSSIADSLLSMPELGLKTYQDLLGQKLLVNSGHGVSYTFHVVNILLASKGCLPMLESLYGPTTFFFSPSFWADSFPSFGFDCKTSFFNTRSFFSKVVFSEWKNGDGLVSSFFTGSSWKEDSSLSPLASAVDAYQTNPAGSASTKYLFVATLCIFPLLAGVLPLLFSSIDNRRDWLCAFSGVLASSFSIFLIFALLLPALHRSLLAFRISSIFTAQCLLLLLVFVSFSFLLVWPISKKNTSKRSKSREYGSISSTVIDI